MEELVEEWEKKEEAKHQTRPVSTVRVQGARDVVCRKTVKNQVKIRRKSGENKPKVK